MKQILGFNVLPEMLILWMLETGACFLGFYLALHGSPLLEPPAGWPFGLAQLAVLDALVLALAVGLVEFAVGLYRPSVCLETGRLLFKTVIGAAASLPAVWLAAKACHIDLAGLSGVQPGWLAALLAWLLILLATRLLYTLAFRMDLLVRRVAVVGEPQAVAQLIEAAGGLRRWIFRIEPIEVPPTGSLSPLAERLWGVVYADPADDPSAGACAGGPASLRDLPARVRRFDAETFWEDQLGRVDIDAAGRRGEAAFAASTRAHAGALAEATRRLLDIVLATLLLLLTTPLLLATALLIRLESPGPVIYRQERVGLHGRNFTLFKFRSMRGDAERHGPSWARVGDPRVTACGSLIRKLRIDELPQIFNILRGDMSMVGPRPERPHFVAQLAQAVPLYQQRCRVKPGLSGWAQINHPYGASVEDARAKLTYDLYYVKHRSLPFDLMILLATVRVILFQEGAR